MRITAKWVLEPLLLVPLAAAGCGVSAPPKAAVSTPSAAEGEAAAELSSGLTKLINEAQIRYRPLDYQYDEDLLVLVDQAEANLAGDKPVAPPKELPRLDGHRLAEIDQKTGALRTMPRLSAEEERAHFRETIRRWEAKRGAKLRPEIDKLKAEVAAREPGIPRQYPEFHKNVSRVFDDFIALEVEEMRERRNRYLHEQVKPLFDRLRARAPQAVKDSETMLSQPPYALPAEPKPTT